MVTWSRVQRLGLEAANQDPGRRQHDHIALRVLPTNPNSDHSLRETTYCLSDGLNFIYAGSIY